MSAPKQCPFCKGGGWVCASCNLPECGCDPKSHVRCTACRPELVDMNEVARCLAFSLTSAHRIIAGETSGVHRILLPGRKRPVIRVERQVIDRILRRSAG